MGGWGVEGAGLYGEVGEVEEQACMGRLGRGRSRPTLGGLGGGGAGLQWEVGEVGEQACSRRWRSRPAGGGGGAGLQWEVEEQACRASPEYVRANTHNKNARDTFRPD